MLWIIINPFGRVNQKCKKLLGIVQRKKRLEFIVGIELARRITTKKCEIINGTFMFHFRNLGDMDMYKHQTEIKDAMTECKNPMSPGKFFAAVIYFLFFN